jgi:hypothetical protein
VGIWRKERKQNKEEEKERGRRMRGGGQATSQLIQAKPVMLAWASLLCGY